MSFSFCMLASGSKGNAILVRNHGRAVLVDNGLSARELLRRVELAGLSAHEIMAIVVSHEHRDHSAGVGVAARKLHCPVYTSGATFGRMEKMDKVDFHPLSAGDPLELAGMVFRPFSTSHDAADPVGFLIEANGFRLGLATDLGQPTALVRQRLAGCHALILESNHDPQMLAVGPYPEYLKQRVRGRRGHLSNRQGADLVREMWHPGLAQVVLAHLSETNNTPALAKNETARALNDLKASTKLHVARQSGPGPVIKVGE